MGPFLLYGLGMHYCRRALAPGGINQNRDTSDDKGDGKQLTHIEGHSLLELNLRLLDEFDKEPHTEAAQQEGAEEETAVHLVQFLCIHPYQEQSQQQVAEGFVELRRMLGLRLG